MKRQKKQLIQWLCTILPVLFLAGCGGESQSATAESTEDAVVYGITENAIPDPDKALKGELKEGGWIREWDIHLAEGVVYRLAQLWEKVDGMDLTQGYYIQILEAPYEQWVNYEIRSDYWDKDIDYEAYMVLDICAVKEGTVYCSGWCAENRQCYLGKWRPDGEGKVIGYYPETMSEKMLNVVSDEEIYAYSILDRNISLLNKDFEVSREYAFNGQLLDIVVNPLNGEVYGCGLDNGGYGVWGMEDNEAVLSAMQSNSPLEYIVNFSEEGILYLADGNALWRMDTDGQLIQLCDFYKRGYVLEQNCGVEIQKDGSVLLLTYYDGAYALLTLKETENVSQQKQELIFATIFETETLKKQLAAFNRSNDKYTVVLQYPETPEKIKEFKDKMQLEISAGRGPDIISGELINAVEYASQGYIQNIDGLLERPKELWQPVLECGKIGGSYYGVPYQTSLISVAYSKELAGNRTSWTLDEFMEAVRESDVEILQPQMDGVAIVLEYGLYDNDNKTFIDWEGGKSHLTEEPFLEFLEFANKYEDKGKYSDEELGEMLLSGKVAAETVSGRPFVLFENLNTMSYVDECFKGQASYIGLPKTEGNGIYVMPRMLYLNSCSKNREGYSEFVNYLVSEEIQKRYTPVFPVRPDAIEDIIGEYRAQRPSTTLKKAYNGIEYPENFEEIQESNFRFMVENACPGNRYISQIEGMIYDELQPYFKGERTAEEAARILNNRVQLYLDERK